jgi:DNA polymerase-3 subunit chi
VAGEVAFHTGVPDKLAHGCRLLRKAYRQGARVVVAGDPALLARLDQALWTFDPLEFVPHARLRRGQAPEARLARTPVWLAEPGAEPPHHEVLVNLGPDMPDAYERYERVIELVGADDDDRAAGRRRWRAYEAAGRTIRHHPAAAA